MGDSNGWVDGDEYTGLLDIYRPLHAHDGDRSWSTYYDIERLVSDARRYRIRAQVAEADSASLHRQLATHEDDVRNAWQSLRNALPFGMDGA